MPQLLASAPSIKGIEDMINRFWFSDRYRVNSETLAIEHPDREPPKGVRVVRKGGRYRFEMLKAEG